MGVSQVILLERSRGGVSPSEHRIVLTANLPPVARVTAALALAFLGDRLLLTDLIRRGLDIPGGHVEAGEHPEGAMRREVYEETGARLGPVRLVAYEQFRLLGPKPADFPFPYPDSYMVFYAGAVLAFEAFVPNDETRGPVLLAPADARATTWVRRNTALYDAALLAVAGTT